MLNIIFLSVFKMSITASFIAFILLFIKYLLQKARFSRGIMMFLWLLIAFKLVCPVAPQSPFSVFNSYTYTKEAEHNLKSEDLSYNDNSNEIILKTTQLKANKNSTDTNNILPIVWLLGVGAMLCYLFVSWVKLKRKLRFAIRKDKGIYMLHGIKSSFVFGIIKPRIYIPFKVEGENLENMIFHEKMHIKRLDHLSKIAAWLILSCHWFNPFVWIMFKLYSTDVELACDEAVVKNKKNRALYMKSLFEISLQKEKQSNHIAVCTFEACIKKRIKNIAAYKKTTAFSRVVSVFACIILCLTFGTGSTKANTKELSPKKEFKNHQKAKEQKLAMNQDLNIPDKTNETIPVANISVPKKDFEYKTNSVSDELYVGYEQLEYENISISNLEANLENDGYIKSGNEADLKNNYIKGSFNSGENVYHSDIKCDKNGNISIYIALNTEAHINVKIFESLSGQMADGGGFVANGKNVYSFIGFNPDKTYDIVINSSVGNEWKINGEYIIY